MAVRDNPVKAKLRHGEVALGTMVFEFASPGLPAILATTGADFVVYDMEHTGLSLETVRALMAWSRGTATVPLVRVPAIDPQFVAHALDVGALGLMVPNVQTPAEAARIVEATRYPPRGGGARPSASPTTTSSAARWAPRSKPSRRAPC